MIDTLISDAYRAEQQRLHADPRGYGGRGRKWADTVRDIARTYGCASILDYGCGQGSLAVALADSGLDVREYDPAVAGKDAAPAPADLVVCTDVLEHVEPDRIWAVVGHLASLSGKALFLVVSLVETAKTLSDGRQAHILLHTPAWWREMVGAHGCLVARELAIKPEKQWVAVLVPEGRG